MVCLSGLRCIIILDSITGGGEKGGLEKKRNRIPCIT